MNNGCFCDYRSLLRKEMGVEDRKKREFLKREREILEAAVELFAEGNWQAVTIDQIAEKAEVGKGTVYKHFKSKDEIYARILLENSRALYWELKKVNPAQSFQERFQQTFRIFWNFYMKDSDFILKLTQYCEQSGCLCCLEGSLQKEFILAEKANLSVYQELLAEGVRAGIIPEQNKYMLMVGLSSITGVIRNIWNSNLKNSLSEDDMQELVEYMARFVLRGWGCNIDLPNQAMQRPANSA